MAAGKLAHNITFELFVKSGDSLVAAEAAIDALAPVPMPKVRAVQWRWHPERDHTKIYELAKQQVTLLEQQTPGDEGPITVLHYKFAKQHDTTKFLARLRELEPQSLELLRSKIGKYLDSEGRLVLKFDRESIALKRLRLSPKGEVVARINLAAFPKNLETCREKALELLS